MVLKACVISEAGITDTVCAAFALNMVVGADVNTVTVDSDDLAGNGCAAVLE